MQAESKGKAILQMLLILEKGLEKSHVLPYVGEPGVFSIIVIAVCIINVVLSYAEA